MREKPAVVRPSTRSRDSNFVAATRVVLLWLLYMFTATVAGRRSSGLAGGCDTCCSVLGVNRIKTIRRHSKPRTLQSHRRLPVTVLYNKILDLNNIQGVSGLFKKYIVKFVMETG